MAMLTTRREYCRSGLEKLTMDDEKEGGRILIHDQHPLAIPCQLRPAARGQPEENMSREGDVIYSYLDMKRYVENVYSLR